MPFIFTSYRITSKWECDNRIYLQLGELGRIANDAVQDEGFSRAPRDLYLITEHSYGAGGGVSYSLIGYPTTCETGVKPRPN